jgi:N-terminal acetyltransferase B complex non-catalytic subunit
LKVYIRARSPSISEKSAVLAHLEELIGKSPAVSDVDAIDLYDEALGEILPDSRESWVRIIGELRWHYVKSAPKLEDESLKCFQACLSRDDLDHARQVSLASPP